MGSDSLEVLIQSDRSSPDVSSFHPHLFIFCFLASSDTCRDPTTDEGTLREEQSVVTLGRETDLER